MTYCVGWKSKDAVFILADTLVTKKTKPHFERSSFNQLYEELNGKFVEESIAKIIPISEDCVIGFAGNISVAIHIIEFIKENYYGPSHIKSILDSILPSLGPFDPGNEKVCLIVATYGVNGPILIHWDNVSCTCQFESDFYQIGSLVSYHSQLTPMILEMLRRGNLPKNGTLPVVSGILLSYGVHDNLIRQKIGGVIFGAYVDEGGVSWQKDTNYIVYPPGLKKLDYISALVRDDVLVINSSVTNIVNCFMSSLNNLSPSQWEIKWKETISQHLQSSDYDFWVFLSNKERKITVILKSVAGDRSKYFSLKHLGGENFDFGISPELMNTLNAPLEDRGDGSVPFGLNFLTG